MREMWKTIGKTVDTAATIYTGVNVNEADNVVAKIFDIVKPAPKKETKEVDRPIVNVIGNLPTVAETKPIIPYEEPKPKKQCGFEDKGEYMCYVCK